MNRNKLYKLNGHANQKVHALSLWSLAVKKVVLLLFSFAVIIITIILASCNPKPLSLKIMTLNVRLDTPIDSFNNWKYRREHVINFIRTLDVDIFGTQELLYNQLQDLKNALSDFSYVGVGRSDGNIKGEYCAIFFKSKQFQVLDNGTFWLSPTEQIPGSKGWDAAYERIVTWAIFYNCTTNQKFAVFNTHLDHVGYIARINSVKLLLHKIGEIAKNIPVIITGDFNDLASSEAIKLITQSQFIHTAKSAKVVFGPDWSFHGFGNQELKSRPLIDFIFVSPDISVEKYANFFITVDTLYLSDHNPIIVELKIN